MNLLRVAQEPLDRCIKGLDEVAPIEFPDERLLERPKDLPGQIIETSAVICLQPSMITCECESLITGLCNPVLRLPPSFALDAKSRTDKVVYCKPEEVLSGGGLGWGPLDGFPEQELEFRPECTKFGSRSEGEVHLQVSGKQENPVHR